MDLLTYRHPRTLAEAFPAPPTLWGQVPASDLAGVPEHRTTYDPRDRIVMAAAGLALATAALLYLF